MNQKNLTRITIDMLPQEHKRLKALAALQGKSMREIVLQSIDSYIANITDKNQLDIEKTEQLFKNLGI